jgi:hypothetical protein
VVSTAATDFYGRLTCILVKASEMIAETVSHLQILDTLRDVIVLLPGNWE